jgi:hypothetical protein
MAATKTKRSTLKLTVQRGIKLWPKASERTTSPSTVIRLMKVGESVWAPVRQERFAAYASYPKKRYGYKYATRAEVKDGVKGTRMWRTA